MASLEGRRPGPTSFEAGAWPHKLRGTLFDEPPAAIVGGADQWRSVQAADS